MTLRIAKSFEQDGPCLYVCSTPIGNLSDTSHRLIDVLRTVDVVAAEDTRQTRKLLTHFDIHPPQLVSLHQHNETARKEDLERWWAEGKKVAVVSDAGTPLISDPGEGAVQFAVEAGVPVVPIPGASAVLAALVASGLNVQPFTFVGFLPRDKKSARNAIEEYAKVPWTLVFYEAPHRLLHTLEVLEERLPTRPAVLGKELTKRHETYFYASNLSELIEHFQQETPRGEYVIVLGPGEPDDAGAGKANVRIEEQYQLAVVKVSERMTDGISHTQAVRQVAEEMGLKRKELYQQTLNRREVQ